MTQHESSNKQRIATEPQLKILRAMFAGVELRASVTSIGLGVARLGGRRKAVSITQIKAMEKKGLIRARDRKIRRGFSSYGGRERIWSLTGKSLLEVDLTSNDSQ